jgi:hypothetical protein
MLPSESECPIRIELEEFALACEKLARFAHLVNGLTDEEREVMLMCTRALELEAIPPHRRPEQGVPLATPLSNVPRITDPRRSQLTQAKPIEEAQPSARRLAYAGRAFTPIQGR